MRSTPRFRVGDRVHVRAHGFAPGGTGLVQNWDQKRDMYWVVLDGRALGCWYPDKAVELLGTAPGPVNEDAIARAIEVHQKLRHLGEATAMEAALKAALTP